MSNAAVKCAWGEVAELWAKELEKVEDVKHFLMRCKTWNGEREELMDKM